MNPFVVLKFFFDNNATAQEFQQSFSPTANAKKKYRNASVTLLAHIFERYLKSSPDHSGVTERLERIPNLSKTFKKTLYVKKSTTRLNHSKNLWKGLPFVLYKLLFPGLKYNTKYLPMYSLTTDGSIMNFLFVNTSLPPAHKEGSAAYKSHGFELREFGYGMSLSFSSFSL